VLLPDTFWPGERLSDKGKGDGVHLSKRVLLILGLLLLLAACGGGGNATPASLNTPESVAPTNPPLVAATATGAPTAQASTPAAPTGSIAATPVTSPATAAATAASTPPAVGGTPRATPVAPPVKFNAPPWQPGEKTTYSVTARDTGQNAGTATYALGREFEADTITAALTVNTTTDNFQLGLTTATLAPVSEVRSVVTDSGTIEIRAEFHAGGATIQTISPAGTKQAQLNLPPVYFANDQFLMLLRALPFAPNYQGSLVLVPSQGDPSSITTTVTVTGQEKVSTVNGDVNCWRVEARFEGSDTPQVLWYGVDAPNYLIKYDNNKYIYLLTGASTP
jgi:hypothetical protein